MLSTAHCSLIIALKHCLCAQEVCFMHQLRTQVGIEILSLSSTLFRGSDRCSLAKLLRQRNCKSCHPGVHLWGSLYSFGCCKTLLRVGIGGALSLPTPSTRAASFTIEVFQIYHPVRTGLSVNHEHVELSEARPSMRELRTKSIDCCLRPYLHSEEHCFLGLPDFIWGRKFLHHDGKQRAVWTRLL